MDTVGGSLGQLFETGRATGVKTIRNTGSAVGSSVQSQLGVPAESNSPPLAKGNSAATASEPSLDQTERTKELVGEFYGTTDSFQSQASPDDAYVQQKLAQDRAELQKLFKNQHDQVYFDQLNKPSSQKPEERTAEKLDRQDDEEAANKKRDTLPPLEEVSTKPARGTPPWARKKFMAEGKDLNSGG